MDRFDPGVEAEFLSGVDLGLGGAVTPALIDELCQRRIFHRRRGGERMIR